MHVQITGQIDELQVMLDAFLRQRERQIGSGQQDWKSRGAVLRHKDAHFRPRSYPASGRERVLLDHAVHIERQLPLLGQTITSPSRTKADNTQWNAAAPGCVADKLVHTL
ncbi:hypothetical protein [Paraburkholderia sp. 31.1]|uniref:hypothetical protein n=1 Tax=Paraburkholderia sp. 31.1 TaxID=2615205 RepID=UPI003974F4C1